MCEASETFNNAILLNGTRTPKACFDIPNTDDRIFQLFFTTNVLGVHLGNQQAIATLEVIIAIYYVFANCVVHVVCLFSIAKHARSYGRLHLLILTISCGNQVIESEDISELTECASCLET